MPSEEGLATLRHKLDVLRAHCETEQRSFEEIEVTVLAPAPSRLEHPMTLTAEAASAFINQLADFGVDHVIVPVVDRESFELVLEDVVPRLRLVPLEV
jgi:2-keto-3-deoxy-L-rhamnonate aldolase RhmA